MTSLVVQTSFLGDVVLTTALIAELAKRGPVDVVTTPEGSTILRNNPVIRTIIDYDRRVRDRGIPGFLRTVSRLRSTRYDTAYLAQGSLRSALLVASSGIPSRIGFDTSEGKGLYTTRIRYRADKHHAERLWWLSMSDCADPPLGSQIMPRLYPSTADIQQADEVLDGLGRDGGRPFIALAPGSAWGTKRWPFYPELAVRIAEQSNVIVVGGPSDSSTGDTIVAQLPPGTGVNAAGRLGFLASAAIIGKAAALVSNDSAPQHFASAMNTPTISIFGPTVPDFGFGPLADGSAVIGLDSLACRPCDHHGPPRCPLGHWRCMREVSSDEVLLLLAKTLSYRASA